MNPIDEAFALVLFHPTILQVRKLGSLVHFDHCVFWLNGNPYELTPAGRKLMQNAHENYVATLAASSDQFTLRRPCAGAVR
jgi:hypothetical protein